MELEVNATSFSTATRLAARGGAILGVAEGSDGMLWVELDSNNAAIPPMLLAASVDGSGKITVVHRCSKLKQSKVGGCWHMAAAINVVRQRRGLPAISSGSLRVDLHERETVPAGVVTDLTPDFADGQPYRGQLLNDAMLGFAAGRAPAAGSPPDDRKAARQAVTSAAKRATFDPERDARRQYLEEQGIPAQLTEAVLQQYRTDVPNDLQSRIPGAPKFRGLPEILSLAVAAFLLGKNVMAVGPKSTGKTTLVHTLAWLFGLPLFELNGNLNTDLADLRGEKTLEVDEKSGLNVVQYVYGVVAEAMQHGGLAHIDEFPNIREGVAIWLNGLDWRKAVEIPGYGVIKAHPAFRLALGGNKGYAGTFEPNEATLDRCVVIAMPYARGVAQIIAQESKNKNAKIHQKLEEFFTRLQGLVGGANPEVRTTAPLTIRGLIDAADLMTLGIPARVALRATVLEKIWNDDFPRDREKVVNLIDSLFASNM